jgi:hypothetical protein
MRVGKISHASIVVQTGKTCCFMDPVFKDPFEANANTFNPQVTLDENWIKRNTTLVIISHAHLDHFSPASLSVFDRSIPVVYPDGEVLIASALERLGFQHSVGVSPGTAVDIDDGLRLLPTGSNVPFPEMGMVFKDDRDVFWNMVDSVIDDSIIASTLGEVSQVGLLFAKYQPMLEEEMRSNALGANFPSTRYGRLLQNVWAVNPRCAVPASCGYEYTGASWLNDRGFPVTEHQFAADLRKVTPDLAIRHVPHGGTIDTSSEFKVDPDGLHFVRRNGTRLLPSFNWRPERGVPPLCDVNYLGFSALELQRSVLDYIDDAFLEELGTLDPLWLDKLGRIDAIWELRLIFPGELRTESSSRFLHFGTRPLRWMSPVNDLYPMIRTEITASGLLGLLTGAINAYAAMCTQMRIMHRLYSVHRDGVTVVGDHSDEPLGKVLFARADEKYLEAELCAVV